MVDSLRGQQIQDVLVDSEVVYIMLTNGTQITIKGVVMVEPKRPEQNVSALAPTIVDALARRETTVDRDR